MNTRLTVAAGDPLDDVTPALGDFDAHGFDLPCQSAEEDLWFAERPEMLNRAKELCAQCPLQEACLEGAIERSEPWGVWGGHIFADGRIVAVKRGRGRPRKAA
ncbi:WhiB family transcriptional regulator [Micrococcales bacterium 31B]|nr:WhiB family transcriptional regulator [Micrococcales bacterium 31B]